MKGREAAGAVVATHWPGRIYKRIFREVERADKQIDLSAISLPRAHVYWSRDHKVNLLIVLTINFLYCALFI